MAVPNIPTDRPHSTPPTNVEASNDYVGADRGLFLTRDPVPKYLRVINAEWTTYGPTGSPGVLRAKIGKYETKPETPDDYNDFTFLTTSDGSEWFEVTTSGPIHKAILAEYWVKFIYYNYYAIKSLHTPILTNLPLIEDIKNTGTDFTRALAPAIQSVENKVVFTVAHNQPLSLSSYKTKVTPVIGDPMLKDLTDIVNGSTERFDPVVTVSRLM